MDFRIGKLEGKIDGSHWKVNSETWRYVVKDQYLLVGPSPKEVNVVGVGSQIIILIRESSKTSCDYLRTRVFCITDKSSGRLGRTGSADRLSHFFSSRQSVRGVSLYAVDRCLWEKFRLVSPQGIDMYLGSTRNSPWYMNLVARLVER